MKLKKLLTYSILKKLKKLYTTQKNTILKGLTFGFILLFFLTGCVVNSGSFEPDIVYFPSSHTLERLPSAFPPLNDSESNTEWAKELYLGIQFAKEMDLYRAITCYKRALFLAPNERKNEIEYHLVEAYYLGRKYTEVVDTYETSTLSQVSMDFPPLKELLLMLYDAYSELGRCAKAEQILNLLNTLDESMANDLTVYSTVASGDLSCVRELSFCDANLCPFLDSYDCEAKSIRKAQVLNALLPGAGYYYVGQKQSALTSFIINALFIYAAYEFFDRGYIAAGLITTSLETGWYFGGINGAGIAARQWNERIYADKAKEYLICQRQFPILMFNYAF